eukprot:TRINITY_DN2110_c0_g1_i3.p1 TRINITY_DN2110_c0_g1~~TRINITY_DN2110_c0_g1_i3.p1  ORF type:complete len:669 (-),score=268.88 TRINITY_DN2110_c0_g1_i3:16-1917(-)
MESKFVSSLNKPSTVNMSTEDEKKEEEGSSELFLSPSLRNQKESVVYPIISPEESFIFVPLDGILAHELEIEIVTLIALALRSWKEEIQICLPIDQSLRDSWRIHFESEMKGFFDGIESLFKLSTEETRKMVGIVKEGDLVETFSFNALMKELNELDPILKNRGILPSKSPEMKTKQQEKDEEELLNDLVNSMKVDTEESKQELVLSQSIEPPKMDYKHHLMVQLIMNDIAKKKGYSSFSRVLFKRIAILFGIKELSYLESQISIQIRLNDPQRKKDGYRTRGDEQYNYLKNAAEEAENIRSQSNKLQRYGKIALATIAGGAIIGITGGLAAPVIAGVLTGWGITAAIASKVLITGLFASYGARSGAKMMAKRTQEIQDFHFIPLKTTEDLSVNVMITGWVGDKGDVIKCWEDWRSDPNSGDILALSWELKAQRKLSSSLTDLLGSKLYGVVKSEILKRTVLATLMAGLWPLGLIQYGMLVDNPFYIACDLAEKAGKVLADVIMQRPFGSRPVSLTGFSLGARVIFFCLKELAEKQQIGIIENAILMGAPVTPSLEEWKAISLVTSGRLVNVYSENDWILGFLYRTANIRLWHRIAGLQAVGKAKREGEEGGKREERKGEEGEGRERREGKKD